MSDDFGSMVARIRTDLNRGTDHDTRIKQAIVDAIKFYRARRLGFNAKRATSSTAAGVEFLALPNDFIENDTLRIYRDGAYDVLEQVTFDWLDENSVNPTHQSVPTKFAVQNRELRLYPIPDATYDVTMSYLYDLSGISEGAGDTATNAWMVEGEELIRSHAMVDLLLSYIGGPESAQTATLVAGREAAVYQELKRRANREQSTGRVQAWV